MNQGLKSYTKQFTHDVSGVGRLAFNMCGAAKNMHMIIPLISTVGQSPINLSLIYNEQDKDVTGQFGKGFRLSTYQKLTYMNMPAPMGLIANIKNADGSVDNYVPLTNPETGYTLSYEHIEDILYGYFLRDQQGNEVQLATTFSHPVMIRNKNGETMSFDSSLDNLNYIQNEYGDIVNFNTSGNTITATYTHNGTVVSKTVLTLQDSQIVYIKYYEGSSTLVGETNIRYLSNGILLTNAITYNLTKVVYENNSYKIYDGFMNGYQEEEFSSTPDYTITYNSILENKPSQTSIKDKFNNLHYYCFDNLNRLNMEIDKEGRVRSFHYDKDTKNLLSMDNVFIKENNNLAKNLQFSISTSEDNSLDNYSQETNAVSEIWNKMKFYNQPAEETKIISCEGEAGDIVTLSFFLTTYLQVQNGGVIITLSCGGETITKSFENKANGELELHSLSLKTKEKYSSISVKLKILNNVSVRLGMFTLLNNAFHQDMVYEGKYISTIANGTNVTSIDYDTNKNPTKVTIKEKTWLERIFNDKNLVTQSTNKYGTVTNIEYDDDYPTNVVKEQIICESEAIMVEEKKEYSPDGRFLKIDYDEFGEKTQFEYDSLGRVTKVTDALNNVLSTTYEKGLLKTLKLNSSTQNTYTYDERNRLTKIELPGSSNYEFVYDYKNQITQIKMNGLVILTYNYDSLGNVTRQRYGTSGDYYDFVYDSKNRVVQIKFNGSLKYIFEYDNNLLIEIYASNGELLKEFIYDEHKRLIRTEDYKNTLDTTIENQINNENKVTGKSITVGAKTLHQSFVDFERSDDALISSSGDVKTIGFAGTNLTSDTQAVMEVFDIYPLHHDANPIESAKVKPFTFTYKNVGGLGQPKTPFIYDSLSKRFVYCANHGTLAYKFGNSTSGTVMARVLKTSSNNEYLFGFVDTNGDKFDVLLEGAGNIVLYVNGNVVTSTRMSFSRNTWHTVALSYGKGTNASSTDTTHTRYYRLFLDGTVKTYSVSSSTEYTSMKSCIGYSEGLSSSFTGQIEMLCFRNAYCEESTLDELMNAINIISTKSYVDEFQRINKKEVTKGSTNIISNEFEYDTTTYWLQKYATYRVEKEVIKAGNNTIATRTYTYDKLGRVTKITDSKFGTKTYSYNDRGFLTNDNGTTITYEGNGNIKKYGSDTFEYGATVKDKLSYVGSTTIQYNNDSLFPSSIGGHLLTWEGRRLKRYTYSGGYYEFEYNEQGLRTLKKNHMGRTTRYYYDGSRLVTEINPSNRLDFLYDEAGLLYGFILNNASKYFYVRDILQNILGIIDESGTLVVKYDYNAFGKILSVTDTSGLSIGEINPFRYKGYYYDEETGYFWLSSRYYSPELGRFIQPADVSTLNPSSINGLNLYSYANNNPIGVAYSSLNVGGLSSGGMVSSISSSFGGGAISGSGGGGSSSPSRNLPSVPGWLGTLSTGLDHGFTMINPIRSAIACLQFTDLWDLMRLDGVTELPGALSKVATGIGWGLSIAGGVIAGYEKYASGASLSSSIAGGLINAGISIGGMYASTAIATAAMGALAASSLAIPGGVIIVGGAVIAVVAGIAINHLFTKLEIGGNTIEGHLNDFVDWLIFWD